MFQQFARLAAAAPGAPAVIDGETGSLTTRSALLRRAEALADELRQAGMRERDLVAVQLPNSVDFVATFLAMAKEKLIVVPIDRDAPETEVGTILSHFAVRALVYRSGGTQISTRSVRERAAVPPGARLIKLTSGSTGKPKGIVTSEENLFADCRNICLTMEIAPYDINFGAIPLSHSYGFSNLVMPLITQGTALVISNDYLPQSIVERCNRHRCTVLPAIPMVFDHLAATDRSAGSFTTLRTFISAGAPLAITWHYEILRPQRAKGTSNELLFVKTCATGTCAQDIQWRCLLIRRSPCACCITGFISHACGKMKWHR